MLPTDMFGKALGAAAHAMDDPVKFEKAKEIGQHIVGAIYEKYEDERIDTTLLAMYLCMTSLIEASKQEHEEDQGK